jgi:hypothetical protein
MNELQTGDSTVGDVSLQIIIIIESIVPLGT